MLAEEMVFQANSIWGLITKFLSLRSWRQLQHF